MNIDLVREANGNVYAICRETGERIQNVMVSSYELRQPHRDVRSSNGDLYRVSGRPIMEITLESSEDIRLTQLSPLQPHPRPLRNPFFLPGMDQGQLAEATRELGLTHAPSGADSYWNFPRNPSGADSYWNSPRGPVFSERPSTVTAPADRVSRELSRPSDELNLSLQSQIGRSVTSDMMSEIERQVMQTFGVPGQINRNGDSISVDIAINQPGEVAGISHTMRSSLDQYTGREMGRDFMSQIIGEADQEMRRDSTSPWSDFLREGISRPHLTPEEIVSLQPLNMPPVEMRIGAAVANVAGLERVNFGMGMEYPIPAHYFNEPVSGSEPTTSSPVASPSPSLFSDKEIIPSLNEHSVSDEIVSTDENFLAFDSANEVIQELIRMFNATDMEGIANLLLRASLYGKDFVSEAWSGFTSHLISEISAESPDHERIGLVNYMCMLTPEEAWKSFILNADSKNWTEMQWDSVASKRIREEMSRPSTVCISSKTVETVEPLDILA